MLLWQSTEKEKRDQKWREREGRVVNVQTVVLDMLSISCDSQANIMVPLCLAQWEFWQNEAITYTTYNFDYLLRQMAPRPPVTVHMGRQTTESPSHFLRKFHNATHVGQQTVVRCFGEIFPSILHVVLGTCCSQRKAKVKASGEQGAPYKSPLLTYEWLSKSCNDSRTHKQRQTYQILQVEDNIRTSILRSTQASRTCNR